MGSIKYTPAEYRTMLRMSQGKFLLVEGRADKRLFQFLLHELFNTVSQATSRDNININSAEDLIQTDIPLGNREKVEQVCDSVQNTPLAIRLIGFVDREFREFDLGNFLNDKLNKHNVIKGVVWSRGHSIENYCFDFLTLQDPLREHSDIDFFDQALDRFRKLFNSTLCLACAVSLAAEQLGKLQRIKGCINWEIVKVTSSEVKLRLDVFKKELVNGHRFTEEDYNLLIENYHKWLERVEKADISCVRWLCHGHIGLCFIWSVYGQCVYEVCENLGFENPEAEVHKVFEAKESGRLRTCISSWIRRALDNLSEYPIEVLNFLDLSIPQV